MMPSLFHIPMELFRAKWTRFAWEARQLPEIGANTAALRQPAPAFTEIAKPKSGRSLS
jgi:hypothetical protein